MNRNSQLHWSPRFLCLFLLLAISQGRVFASVEIDNENWFEPKYQVHATELLGYATENPVVLQGSYWRIYQFLAYRALIGHPLSAEQVKGLKINGWHIINPQLDFDTDDPLDAWMTAREAMPGVQPIKIDRYRSLGRHSYLNCSDDAFARATATLKDRRRKGGDQWAGEWLKGQDAVFANCSGVEGLILPPELPPQAPEWLQADRRYQQAAVQFYSELFDLARSSFLAIAEDKASPWNSLGNYLAARSLVRKASLNCDKNGDTVGDSEKTCKGYLGQAILDLAPVLPTLPAARYLLGLIKIESTPEERFDELAKMLTAPELPPEYQQVLLDYLLLFDRFPAEKRGMATAPLTRWILAMQNGAVPEKKEAALNEARKNWKTSKEEQWLVPLVIAGQGEELTAEELQAVQAIPQTSPAYVTLSYYLAKQEIRAGQLTEARRIVSGLLQSHGKKMAFSTQNRFARLQLQLAETPDAFFAAAPRRYLKTEKSGEEAKKSATKPDSLTTYDTDAWVVLNNFVPLSLLQKFATRQDLPPIIKETLPEAVWTFSVLLGDYATADTLTDLLAEAATTNKELWRRYQNGKNIKDKEIAAILILVNSPEFRPYINSWRDDFSAWYDNPHYWWCQLGGRNDGEGGDNRERQFPGTLFLSKEEKAQAAKEQAQLASLPNGTDYLAPFLLARARDMPDDPDIPKALHLLVQATKGGCISKETSVYSRDAFRLLHKKYPRNEWTKKTPYHY